MWLWSVLSLYNTVWSSLAAVAPSKPTPKFEIPTSTMASLPSGSLLLVNATVKLPSEVALMEVKGVPEEEDEEVTFQWKLDESSPAEMSLLGDSSHTRRVLIGGLSPGAHLVSVSVTRPDRNVTERGSAYLVVERSDAENESVELFFHDEETVVWDQARKEMLADRLSAVLAPFSSVAAIRVHITRVDRIPLDGRYRAVFYAEATKQRSALSAPSTALFVLPARELVSFLRAHAPFITEMKVDNVETLYCLLECSGHGRCDQFEKRCVCEWMWMPNMFLWTRNGFRSMDCSWSTMRVYGLLFMVLILVATLYYFSKHKKSRRSSVLARRAMRRRLRYEHLKNDEEYEKKKRGRSRRSAPGSAVATPTLQALPPRRWSSSSSLSSENEDLLQPEYRRP